MLLPFYPLFHSTPLDYLSIQFMLLPFTLYSAEFHRFLLLLMFILWQNYPLFHSIPCVYVIAHCSCLLFFILQNSACLSLCYSLLPFILQNSTGFCYFSSLCYCPFTLFSTVLHWIIYQSSLCCCLLPFILQNSAGLWYCSCLCYCLFTVYST
jgi:hypothetical protein